MMEWFCPICLTVVNEPSPMSGRSWCRCCEEYLIPFQPDALVPQ